MKRQTTRPILAALAVIALSSCASSVPPDTFEISSPAVAQAASRRSRLQVLIPEPTAIKTLDSDKIVVKPTPYSVEFLANSQWGDRLPRMVQLRLLQAFENTGGLGAVGVPGQGLAIDYQLVMEIRKFEIDAIGQGSTALIEISVKALNDRNGTVRATRIFDATAPVSGNSNSAYVAALDKAFDKISNDIVGWTIKLI